MSFCPRLMSFFPATVCKSNRFIAALDRVNCLSSQAPNLFTPAAWAPAGGAVLGGNRNNDCKFMLITRTDIPSFIEFHLKLPSVALVHI